MSDVTYTRPEVEAMTPTWDLVRDAIAGEAVLKAWDLGTVALQTADRYLPKPNASDLSTTNAERYRQYIERAVYYNVTGRTHEGLVGMVFQKEPVIVLPSPLDILLDDCDGTGTGIAARMKAALGHTLAYGRAGLLADFPKRADPETSVSKADIQSGNIRPSIVLYEPWQIINWRTKVVGAKRVLTLVVLSETTEDTTDEFESETVAQYRVLRLNDAGAYQVDIYRAPDDSAAGTELTIQESSNPLDGKGRPLTEIPFQFIGAVNNDDEVDSPPMLDLATLNIAHYRNSADYEESVFICGQPTPWVSGLTQVWVDKHFKNGIPLGSRSGLMLPVGGQFGMDQATPNGQPFEAMQLKERQMVALGAKLIEQRAVQRTATEARMDYATEISVLGTCARNVAQAYTRALAWCAAFADATGEAKAELSPDFALGKLTPQERAQLVMEFQAKVISFTELRGGLRATGVATQDDEEAKEEIAATIDYGPGQLGGAGSGEPDEEPTEEQT